MLLVVQQMDTDKTSLGDKKGGTSGADMRQGCQLVHRRLEYCFSQQIFKYSVTTTYKYQN